MSGLKSTYAAAVVADWYLGRMSSIVPPLHYFARLYTTLPADNATGGTPVLAAKWKPSRLRNSSGIWRLADAYGHKRNRTALFLGYALEQDLAGVAGFGLWDQETGGNLWLLAQFMDATLTTPTPIGCPAGYAIRLPKDQFVIRED